MTLQKANRKLQAIVKIGLKLNPHLRAQYGIRTDVGYTSAHREVLEFVRCDRSCGAEDQAKLVMEGVYTGTGVTDSVEEFFLRVKNIVAYPHELPSL
jgi:hypothetical protein